MSMHNDIPPQERILIRSEDAADLLSMSYSDFRARVRSGEIPVAERAGTRSLFSVDFLRSFYSKRQSS